MPRKYSVAFLAVLFIFASEAKYSNLYAQEEEQKVKTVTFIADDAQKKMVSKVYDLKNVIAADIAPFVLTAVKRFNQNSTANPLVDVPQKKQLLVVSTTVQMMPYVDEMVSQLDRPGKLDSNGSLINGTGVVYGSYSAKYRATETMRRIIVDSGVASSIKDGTVYIDPQNGTFYFKDTKITVDDIIAKLKILDKPAPQTTLTLKIYEIRNSDIKDIGIDYLAWKNGPGLNLFNAAYEALDYRVADALLSQITQAGFDVSGAFPYGFGGMYTAPAFDFSFVRLLQQNGKAIINSTASIVVNNDSQKIFSTSFSPEYQNITKDEDHKSDVTIGGNASLNAYILNPVSTAGENGGVSFHCSFDGANVVERNNHGAEISERTIADLYATIPYGKERVLTTWKRTTTVQQTIGVPFLCELPILKYIFGTTTSNEEETYFIVTATAEPLSHDATIKPGILSEFSKSSADEKQNQLTTADKQ